MRKKPKDGHPVKTWNDKLKILREKQGTLMEKLSISFDVNTYRELNITNQKIIVTEEQKKGNWKKPRLSEFFTK
jgi:hypothetical protein